MFLKQFRELCSSHLFKGSQEEFLRSIRMAHADFIGCDSHKWAMFYMQLVEARELVTFEDMCNVPEPGEGGQERPRDDTQWGQISTVVYHC